ncbi:hypothetical protein [Halobacteriovorax sp.]|uniref:hypothetical protein n=1 Tax=Halobacteriovorax sp. TaxID=2020862 RepID=UPI003567B5A1
MRRIYTFLVFILTFSSPSWSLEQGNIIGLVESSLSNINDPFRVKCGQEIEEEVLCPHMAKQFEHDSKVGLFFWLLSDSPWESCKKTLPSIEHITTNELEDSLSTSKDIDLGLKRDYFSKMFNKCFDTKHKSSTQIENQKKVAISMSYNYLNKIGDNTKDLSKEILEINSTLGNDLLNGLPCEKYILPENAHLCEKIKEDDCSPKKGLSKLSNDLFEDAIGPIIAISKKIKEVRARFFGRSGSKTRKNKIDTLKAGISFIKAEYPLLQGDKISKYIDNIVDGTLENPAPKKFKRVVKDQLISNKRRITESLNSNLKMSNCIIYGDKGNCDDFDKDFRKIPYQSTPFSRHVPSSNRIKSLASMELYQVPECLDRSRNLKNDFNSFAADTSLNIGLTIFTGGASLAVRAGQLGRIALTSRAAALGADSLFLYKSIDESITSCNEYLNTLDNIEHAPSSFSCPSKVNDNIHYVKKRDVNSCVTAALLNSLDVLPFLPVVSSKFARIIDDPLTPNPSFRTTKQEGKVLGSSTFKSCINNMGSKACTEFSKENSEIIIGMHKKCFSVSVLRSNKSLCTELETFIKNNSTYRLSEMIPSSARGKSVVVEFNADRGHITLRYFKEVEENGEAVMKAFSFDGPSWLLPRRVNRRTFASNKKADTFDSFDEYVPGSHYVIDISPQQLETVHNVAKKGGFSKACTHDARIALDEAGILSMPKGISNTFNKITIKQLAKDLTTKYGPPKQSTIKALEGGLDNSSVGFSREQWRTFGVTEFGWLVLTPVVVGGVYPSGIAVGGASTVVIADQAGKTIVMTKEKFKKFIEELSKL